MISKKMEEAIHEIYADSNVSPLEIIKLRNLIDETAAGILREEGREGILDAVGKSFDVTNELLQLSILHFSKPPYTESGRAAVMSLLESEIELLKANLQAFA